MPLNSDMLRYISDSREELLQLIRELCAIPAPSRHEDARAEYCLNWFRNAGFPGAYTDEEKNVICPLNADGDIPLTVFIAHTDTVFPDTLPMPFYEDGEVFRCPGVTDDTANLAVLMIAARYFIRSGSPAGRGLIIAAGSCEEGLGNLIGSRAIVRRYGDRIAEFIAFDGNSMQEIFTRAVGSHRYRVTVRTAGGHSFNDFGSSSAIHCIAALIHGLCSMDVPSLGGSRTTYNVGMVEGGTSVNTIAQSACMMYEYRSDDAGCLEQMRRRFLALADSHRREGVEITVESVGERPCASGVDEGAMRALTERAAGAIYAATARKAVPRCGSTDCNSALAAGIPAVCVSVCEGGGEHTREEYLLLNSLEPGCRIAMELIAHCFE